MIKKLVIVFVAIIAIQSYGQEGTASPYSFYGIGNQKFKGTVENRSMGGLSIYSDSIHVNLRNPSSYAGKNLDILNNESRPVKFAVGGSYTSTSLKSDTSKDKASASSFDYLAMSIPMGDFGFGFGLIPYTSVGYKLEAYRDDEQIENRFNGEGGINKAFLGFGYQLTSGLSIGVDFQYNFGNIQNSITEYVYDSEGDPIERQSRENNRSDLSGLNFNLAATYKAMLNEKLELVTSVTYRPESNLTSKNERSISTITTTTTNVEYALSTIETDLGNLQETELVLPSRISYGLGIGQPRKWFVGVESEYSKTSDFSNALYSNGATYEDQTAFKLGGFYIPKYNSFSSYAKRIVYRAGFHYENTGLNIENESINEFGMSFGLGLPVGSFFSNANLGVEVGKRGTTNSNLIQENFVNFQLSLSLNDRWFNKRKFD